MNKIDIVFVNSDQCLLDAFTFFASNKKVDTYDDIHHFLDVVYRYPKHTKIMLGQNFSNFGRKGIQIAEYLHALGFSRLYLFTFDTEFFRMPRSRLLNHYYENGYR